MRNLTPYELFSKGDDAMKKEEYLIIQGLSSQTILSPHPWSVPRQTILFLPSLCLIWQMANKNKRDGVQRDFLKFNGQQILMKLKRTLTRARVSEGALRN